MPQINISSELLVAQRRSNRSGYTWTLASRLGDMLDMAEYLFGPRDCSYTLLGIEFESTGPRIWYPGNHRHIIIQLGPCAATNMSWACYQMAHETVHLLAPTGDRNAKNLEEGVACYFADYYMMDRKIERPEWAQCLPKNYKCALEAVTPLLDNDIDCVRRIRKNQPSFWDMTKEDISEEFPNLESEDVDFLISEFGQDAGS